MKNVKRLYSSLPCFERSKACAYINLENLKHNYNILTNNLSCRPICVIKADAYGHGGGECAKALYTAGCDFFAVSSIEEAVDVRIALFDIEEKKRPADILILGYTPPMFAKYLAEYNIIQSGVSFEYCTELEKNAKEDNVNVKIHIAIDTGMNRIGFPAQNDLDIMTTIDNICLIKSFSNISINGVFTHFANADGNPHENYTPLQFERFLKIKNALENKGINGLFYHACNSAAAIRYPKYHLDGVRFGIALYGYDPSEYVTKDGLLPVMRLETVISHIHILKKGDALGYGCDYIAEDDMSIATLPIGYADGYVRGYKGSYVTVYTESGKYKARIIGRICMDQCMIDISLIKDARVHDKVVLMGDSKEHLTKLAENAGSFEYEALCLISSRVPRIYRSDAENESNV